MTQFWKRVLPTVVAVALAGCSPLGGWWPDQKPLGPHPARVVLGHYQALPKDVFTTPYDVFLRCLEELHQGRTEPVRKVIEWHFSRLNKIDSQGMGGTAYDLTLEGDRETSTGKYDSVDGYSGLFLCTLLAYVRKTGDSQTVIAHWSQVLDIAYTIAYLQQPSGPMHGLTIATPEYRVAYLMDNCEALGGIESLLELARITGQTLDVAYYRNVAAEIRKGINDGLRQGDGWFWENDNGHRTAIDWTKAYPDAYAQVFPCFYDAVEKPQRRALWRKFARLHPSSSWSSEPIERRIFLRLVQRKMEAELAQEPAAPRSKAAGKKVRKPRSSLVRTGTRTARRR